MKLRSITKALAAAFLLAGAAHAAPIKVIFDDIGPVSGPVPITSTGFLFTGAGASSGALIVAADGAACGPPCASNGTQAMLVAGENVFFASSVAMTRSGGGTFVLSALDGGEMFSGAFPQWAAAEIDYVGYLGASTVMSGSLVLDGIIDGPGGANDFQTFSISGSLIDRIVFSGSGGTNGNNGFSLDNLVVGDAVVPEPSSMVLVGLALLGLRVARRRV